MTRAVNTALAGSGGVLQVVNATYGTQASTTNTANFVTTGFTLSITPSSPTSKILILSTSNGYQTAAAYVWFTVFRDAVNLGNASYGFGELYGNTGDRFGQVSLNFLDSPATTSAITYSVRFKVSSATGYMNLNTGEFSTMSLLEIAG
jgi:hypothetical protein